MASPLVTACLVTRGDVDLSPILESLPPEWPIAIWDNSQRENLSVYGRYALLSEIDTPVAYVQDDDCIVSDPGEIVRAWWITRRIDGFVVCNMPQEFRQFYTGADALVGFGAAFHRDAPVRAFGRYSAFVEEVGKGAYEALAGPTFNRTCDIVFTGLTPTVLVDVEKFDRDFATADDRMYRQPEHVAGRQRMRDLVAKVRDAS